MTTQEKLDRIKNRMTKYELACDGRYLAGYTRRSKSGILDMLRKNGQEWAKRISDKDMITFAHNGQSAELGRFHIAFTGRTQRDAIIEGELPWFEQIEIA